MSFPKPVLLLLLLTFTVGCPSAQNDDDDDDDGNWNVEIVNDTANTMELLHHRPCPSEDPEDWNEIPISPDGVAPGETERTFLPQPGCFDLSAEGEGCFAEGTTGTMQIGDEVTWTITEDDLACSGG
jgi:hypothetical protein